MLVLYTVHNWRGAFENRLGEEEGPISSYSGVNSVRISQYLQLGCLTPGPLLDKQLLFN